MVVLGFELRTGQILVQSAQQEFSSSNYLAFE